MRPIPRRCAPSSIPTGRREPESSPGHTLGSSSTNAVITMSAGPIGNGYPRIAWHAGALNPAHGKDSGKRNILRDRRRIGVHDRLVPLRERTRPRSNEDQEPPRRSGAHEHVVRAVGHGVARCGRELGVVLEPPEKGVRVEQESHESSLPRGNLVLGEGLAEHLAYLGRRTFRGNGEHVANIRNRH